MFSRAPHALLGRQAHAEPVAALRKRPAAKSPDEVSAFVTRIGTTPSPESVSATLSALKRIKTKSELQELWERSNSSECSGPQRPKHSLP